MSPCGGSGRALSRKWPGASLLVTLLGLMIPASALAQATRTWVSGTGNDANPCSRTAPCKTFAGAISKTAAGGEIDALDPGGYGGLTITKSITIDGGGGQVASVLVAGTNGITVSAASNDHVVLRNLRIYGLAGNGSNLGQAGINGVSFLGGASLRLENVTISGFAHNGVLDTNPGSSKLSLSNTTIADNFGDGVLAAPGSGASQPFCSSEASWRTTTAGWSRPRWELVLAPAASEALPSESPSRPSPLVPPCRSTTTRAC